MEDAYRALISFSAIKKKCLHPSNFLNYYYISNNSKFYYSKSNNNSYYYYYYYSNYNKNSNSNSNSKSISTAITTQTLATTIVTAATILQKGSRKILLQSNIQSVKKCLRRNWKSWEYGFFDAFSQIRLCRPLWTFLHRHTHISATLF